jgi:3-hydroxyacyl-CoA dehydrogenase
VPNEVPPSDPAPTIALIGATPIAELIAARALRANLNVIIDDISDTRLQATSRNLRAVVGAQHRCAPGPQDQSASPQSLSSPSLDESTIHPQDVVRAQHRCAPGPQDHSASPQSVFSSPVSQFSLPTLHLTQSIESAIRSSDFLIDALPDDLEVKLELFTLFDKFAKPNAIFITTGSIPIDDLAAITFCPDRCLAVRLTTAPNDSDATFHPLPGTQTSPHTLAKAINLFLHSLRFRAI